MTGWAAFWLFVSLVYLVDTYVFLKGYNTFFWSYKTPIELESQKKKLLGVELQDAPTGFKGPTL